MYGISFSKKTIVPIQSATSSAGRPNQQTRSSHREMAGFCVSNRPPTSAAAKKKEMQCCEAHSKLVCRHVRVSPTLRAVVPGTERERRNR